MNKSNPRLLVNRESIYERQLPGDAYITVYVQRLQHGYYSSSAVSDPEAENVDFLALGFVFHSPHTLSHRFKSATIRASVQGHAQLATDTNPPQNYRPKNPRILMHAPHLIYGTVSPETMEWTFSLAGSIGVSEAPVSANVIPSGSINSRYRRYEMMRIQGSARTLKSPRGRQFDIEAGEVVWSLEENNLQRSGLPREFTFVMLIEKPSSNSRVKLSLDIDPVIQSWWGSYPSWSLGMPSYRPAKRRDVDFNKEVGQRFEPLDEAEGRGFNFATLVSRFDDYIAMPGRHFSRKVCVFSLSFSFLSEPTNSIRWKYQKKQTRPNENIDPVIPVNTVPSIQCRECKECRQIRPRTWKEWTWTWTWKWTFQAPNPPTILNTLSHHQHLQQPYSEKPLTSTHNPTT